VVEAGTSIIRFMQISSLLMGFSLVTVCVCQAVGHAAGALVLSRYDEKKILDLITDIPGLEGEVLTRRYVHRENWEEICEGIHYSWTGVFRIHDRALRMVQDRLDQGDTFDS
jgi:hypothetical protein